jgi:hypothetical protein
MRIFKKHSVQTDPSTQTISYFVIGFRQTGTIYELCVGALQNFVHNAKFHNTLSQTAHETECLQASERHKMSLKMLTFRWRVLLHCGQRTRRVRRDGGLRLQINQQLKIFPEKTLNKPTHFVSFVETAGSCAVFLLLLQTRG